LFSKTSANSAYSRGIGAGVVVVVDTEDWEDLVEQAADQENEREELESKEEWEVRGSIEE